MGRDRERRGGTVAVESLPLILRELIGRSMPPTLPSPSARVRALFYKIMDRATVSNCGLNNYFCTDGHNLTNFVIHRLFNCVAKTPD
jgi:hypothetical protein